VNVGSIIASGVLVLIVATALVVFRNRVAEFLLPFTVSDEPEGDRRRNLTIGVVLVAVFAYVLAAIIITANVAPSTATPWVIGIGLVIDFFVAIIYWIRFQQAGLSPVNWMRR
jgi:glycerol uptake facilitator-like aquaporin